MPKNILFIGAEPTHRTEMKVEAERRLINKELDSSRYFLFDHAGARIENLLKELENKKISILHFSGHRSPRISDGKGGIQFLSAMGDYAEPSDDEFIKIIEFYQKNARKEHPFLECIVLNACNTEELLSKLKIQVFCAITTTQEINPHVAQNFSKHFYSQLSVLKDPDKTRYKNAYDRALMLLPEGMYVANFEESLIKHIDNEQPIDLSNQLSELLSDASVPLDILSFLKNNPNILKRAFGTESSATFFWSCKIHNQYLHICISEIMPTTGFRNWRVVMLGLASGNVLKSIEDIVLDINHLRQWTSENLIVARQSIPDFKHDFKCTIIAGQRGNLSQDIFQKISSINKNELGIEVRTYDRLLEITNSLST